MAYLSGLETGTDIITDTSIRFTSDDVDRIRLPLTANAEFKGIDVLLTSQWPLGVDKYGNSVVCILVSVLSCSSLSVCVEFDEIFFDLKD